MTKQKSIIGLLKKYYSIWMPILAYIILCGMKALFSMRGFKGPISYEDEWLYIRYGREWFLYGEQYGTHYPPIYPLLLSFAFWFKNSYGAISILNILYSSLSVVILYFIGRLYFDKKKSTFFMIAGTTVISQFIFPVMVLSENVYFPLFFFVIFLCLKPDGWECGNRIKGIASDILLGIVLAALCLTRYITIVMLPVIALVWLFKQLDNKIRLPQIFLRGAGILLFFVLTYLPWYLLNSKTVPFKNIIGFGITSNTNPAQLTGGRLLVSILCYAAYFILLAAPVLPLLIRSVGAPDFKKLTSDYNRLWIMVTGLSSVFFIAVARHSWRASYNYPDFKRVMGRYLIYFPVLFILLALVTWEKEKNLPQNRVKNNLFWIISTLSSVVLIIISYEVALNGAFLGINHMVQPKGSYDIYRLKEIGNVFLVGISVLLIGICFLAIYEQEKIKKYSFCIISLLLVCYNIWGVPGYRKMLADSYANERSYSAGPRTEFNEILNDHNIIQGLKIYFDLEEDVNLEWERRYMKFFNKDEYLAIADMAESPLGDSYYVVCDKTTVDKYKKFDTEELGRFFRDGEENIVLFIKKNPDKEEIYSSLYINDFPDKKKKHFWKVSDSILNYKFYRDLPGYLDEYLERMCAGAYLDDQQRIIISDLNLLSDYNLLRYMGCRYIFFENGMDEKEIDIQDTEAFPVMPVGELYGDMVLKQEIFVTENYLDSVSVRLATYGKDLKEAGGCLKLVLKEHDGERILSENVIALKDMVDEKYEKLVFPSVKDSQGRTYDLFVISEGIEKENAVTVWSYGKDAYDGNLTIDGMTADNDLIIRGSFGNACIINKEYGEDKTTADLGECAARVSLIDKVIIGDRKELLDKMCEQYSEHTLFLDKKDAEADRMTVFSPLEENENAQMLSKTDDKAVILATVNAPRYILINEYFGKHWTLYVDGKKQKLMDGNCIMNSVYLESAGTHEIVLRYHSGYSLGVLIAVLSLVSVFVAVFAIHPKKQL